MPKAQPSRRRRGCLARLIGRFIRLALVFMMLCYPFVEPYLLTTEQKTLVFSDLPASFSGMRVLYLSDIHFGSFFSRERLYDLVRRVNAMQPDLILLGGDYAEDSDGAVAFFEMQPGFQARMGVYAVPGNHDRVMPESNLQRLQQAMTAASVTPLINTSATLTLIDGSSIRIAGIDDYGNGHPDAAAAARDLAREDFVIFLTHNPDILPQLSSIRAGDGSAHWADLILCGHTHGGQITLFGQRALFSVTRYGERYRTGWKQELGAEILISSGIGTSVVPMRFFAPPKMHLITLRSK